jgi:hypothetical protein
MFFLGCEEPDALKTLEDLCIEEGLEVDFGGSKGQKHQEEIKCVLHQVNTQAIFNPERGIQHLVSFLMFIAA